jgi:hypothetical protein
LDERFGFEDESAIAPIFGKYSFLVADVDNVFSGIPLRYLSNSYCHHTEASASISAIITSLIVLMCVECSLTSGHITYRASTRFRHCRVDIEQLSAVKFHAMIIMPSGQ